MTKQQKPPTSLGAAIAAHYAAKQTARDERTKKTNGEGQATVTELQVGLAQGAAEGGNDAA